MMMCFGGLPWRKKRQDPPPPAVAAPSAVVVAAAKQCAVLKASDPFSYNSGVSSDSVYSQGRSRGSNTEHGSAAAAKVLLQGVTLSEAPSTSSWMTAAPPSVALTQNGSTYSGQSIPMQHVGPVHQPNSQAAILVAQQLAAQQAQYDELTQQDQISQLGPLPGPEIYAGSKYLRRVFAITLSAPKPEVTFEDVDPVELPLLDLCKMPSRDASTSRPRPIPIKTPSGRFVAVEAGDEDGEAQVNDIFLSVPQVAACLWVAHEIEQDAMKHVDSLTSAVRIQRTVQRAAGMLPLLFTLEDAAFSHDISVDPALQQELSVVQQALEAVQLIVQRWREHREMGVQAVVKQLISQQLHDEYVVLQTRISHAYRHLATAVAMVQYRVSVIKGEEAEMPSPCKITSEQRREDQEAAAAQAETDLHTELRCFAAEAISKYGKEDLGKVLGEDTVSALQNMYKQRNLQPLHIMKIGHVPTVSPWTHHPFPSQPYYQSTNAHVQGANVIKRLADGLERPQMPSTPKAGPHAHVLPPPRPSTSSVAVMRPSFLQIPSSPTGSNGDGPVSPNPHPNTPGTNSQLRTGSIMSASSRDLAGPGSGLLSHVSNGQPGRPPSGHLQLGRPGSGGQLPTQGSGQLSTSGRLGRAASGLQHSSRAVSPAMPRDAHTRDSSSGASGNHAVVQAPGAAAGNQMRSSTSFQAQLKTAGSAGGPGSSRPSSSQLDSANSKGSGSAAAPGSAADELLEVVSTMCLLMHSKTGAVQGPFNSEEAARAHAKAKKLKLAPSGPWEIAGSLDRLGMVQRVPVKSASTPRQKAPPMPGAEATLRPAASVRMAHSPARGQQQQQQGSSAAAVPDDVPMAVMVDGVQWTLGTQLGAGAYGKVYAAMDRMSGRQMAVKVIRLSAVQNVESLQHELSLYRKLAHPHIVSYIGSHVDRSNDVLYIFMELVSGGCISNMLTDFGAFSEPVVSSYTRQILQGLEYLHAQRIVHRDLKGANILVTLDGMIKLADFGTACILPVGPPTDGDPALGNGTMTLGAKSLRGSIFWISPEIVKRTGHGRRADIWSLGCTVIEMLTGMHPWPDLDGETHAWGVMLKIATSNTGPPRPSNASPVVLDFLDQCLQINPEHRPTAAQLLQHPFITGEGWTGAV